MILNDNSIGEVVHIGENTAKKATINSDKLSKLQYMLTTGLYGDPIGAVVTELSNNGMDSIIESGKNISDNPMVVEICGEYTGRWIEWRDQGLGMTLDTFETVVMSYLSSTKEDSNTTIGCWGLGAKSTLSLERPAQWTIRKDGKEWKLLFYQGVEFAEYDLLTETDTTEPDGVTIRVNIKDYSEYNSFCTKAKEKLVYYDGVVLIIDKQVVDNKIYRFDKYQVGSMKRFSTMHLSLKDVYYDIDWIALGIERIDVGICLRFSLEDGLSPTPSRERLIYNESTKTAIKNRIKEVATEIITDYNNTITDSATFLEALPNADIRYPSIKLYDGYSATISDLGKHSDIPIRKHSCPLTKLYSVKHYMSEMLMTNYSMLCIDDGYYIQTKHNNYTLYMSICNNSKSPERLGYNGRKILLFNKVPKRNEKEYFRWLYGGGYMCIKKDVSNIDYIKSIYRDISSHTIAKKSIKEYVKERMAIEEQISSIFIDHTDLFTDEKFIEFCETRKKEAAAKRRENRENGYTTGLCKAAGDVTIAFSKPNNNRNYPFVFKKQAVAIDSLHNNSFFTIMFTEVDKEDAILWCTELLRRKVYNNRIKVALVGVNEIKKISVHNFKTIKQMISERSKPLARIVTAHRINSLIINYDNINSHDIGNRFLTGISNDITILRKYVEENFLSISMLGKEFYEALISAAEDNKLWDESVMDSYRRVEKDIEMIEFVSFIQAPSRDRFMTDEQKKKCSRLINLILVAKKVKYGAFDNFVLVEKVIEQDDNDSVVAITPEKGEEDNSDEEADEDVDEEVDEDEIMAIEELGF